MRALTFEHPAYWLLFIPIMLAFTWIARRSNAPLAPDQVRQSLILRLIAALFIVAAIASPLLRLDTRRQTVVFLLDVSRSISPEARAREFDLLRQALAAKPKRDSAGVITFASSLSVDTAPTLDPAPPTDHVGVDDQSTDIGAAIRTASAVMPAAGGKQIVLLTDGNETTGDALQQASAASIPVSSVDPTQFLGTSPPEVSVARVDLPATVHEGEPMNLRAVIASSVQESATITIRSGGQAIKTVPASLGVGKNLVVAPIVLQGSGVRQVEVDVDAPQDTLLQNNRADCVTQVIGKPRILYLTDQPQNIDATIEKAMKARSLTLDVMSATQAPQSVAGFAAYDGVVLSDTPSSELSHDQQVALQSAVRDFGVGLGMVGGVSSFIGGGWQGTPVEQALPVLMKPRQDKKMPAADIVVVLDASGSMSLEENGIEKVQLAARAAVSLLGNLQPDDRVAIIAVTTVPTVVLPFMSPAHALAAKKDIEGVEADGGGIYCLVGLEAAYDMLDSSKAAIKHVIICPDTDDSEQQEHCVALARTMRLSDNVTTSVCGIGDWSDHDVPFQRQLADAGGGQLFVVSQATDLPQFFERDISRFQAPPFVEGVFEPRVDSADKLMAGLNMAAEPPLLGYNIVTPKAEAKVPMHAPSNPDPIFAYQTYGLGHTFAFTSDETDHWAARWLPWPGYTSFWTQILRWSLRTTKPANFEAFADIGRKSATGHIVVDAFSPDGAYRNGAAFSSVIAGPSGQPSRVALTQTAPGRYEAQFPAAHLGAYLITVSRAGAPQDGQADLGVAQSYPAEYAQSAPDLPLLQQMADATGGRVLEDPSEIWRLQAGASENELPLAALCLMLGTLLFIADIAWRRLGIRVHPGRSLAPIAVAVATAARGSVESARSARISAVQTLKSTTQQAQGSPEDTDDLLSRPVEQRLSDDEADNPFPLVASLDDLRRRERGNETRK